MNMFGKNNQEINWEIDELVKLKEGDFEKGIESLTPSELSERLERLATLTRKPDLDQPLATGEERGHVRAKLLKLQTIIRRVRDRKLKEADKQQAGLQEEWKKQTLIQQLPNIRIASGDQVFHLEHGTYTLDAVSWETPTSTEITIKNRKVDLQKLFSPATLKGMLTHPFTPLVFVLQPMGGYIKDKPVGYFSTPEEAGKAEPRPALKLAVMKV
jgi:hypothetical protein